MILLITENQYFKMKKALSIIAFMFVVSISANAQTQNPKEAGKTDAKNLSEFVELKEGQQDKLAMYFATKHDAYQVPNLSDARKAALGDYMMTSLTEILTPEQMAKLKTNPALLNKLTGITSAKK
ncbi:hypothetical protein [Flavobacterium ardleyense]|uniref:hypothetical protein n=1 Tax=Flavobacterium ardleyense TaxID=2038737 RepID=UPI00298D4BC2|nr:hypothetical protein [Flavobacterium ardleyense]